MKYNALVVFIDSTTATYNEIDDCIIDADLGVYRIIKNNSVNAYVNPLQVKAIEIEEVKNWRK